MISYAVLLMAYGGPNSLDDIEPYLRGILSGREMPPELVEEVQQRYALVGRRSPLLEITRAQARALEERLNVESEGRAGARPAPTYRVYVGMRHWHPYIRQAVEQMVEDGLRHVVALCMTPHYSRMSVGAYFEKLREVQEALGVALNVAHVKSYHDHPLLIQAIAEKVQTGLECFPAGVRDRVRVLFTAHSLPAALLQRGDPYDAQVRETARLVAARVGLEADRWQFCYQCAGAGNVLWLGPQIEEVVVELAKADQTRILVAPIGFVADHVEVLYDVDIACRNLAAARGVHLERTESLNTTPLFIEALTDIVRRMTGSSSEFPRVPKADRNSG